MSVKSIYFLLYVHNYATIYRTRGILMAIAKFDFEKNFEDRKKRLSYLFGKKDMSFEKFDYPKELNMQSFQKYGYVDTESKDLDILTQEQALEELRRIEYIFRYYYAGYYVFGKGLFENAFVEIEREIKKIKTIKTLDFLRIIIEKCDFLVDKHIGFQDFSKRGETFWLPFYRKKFFTHFNKDYEIVKKARSFYINIGDKSKKIIKVNNASPNEYIKKFVDSDGFIKYAIIFSSTPMDCVEVLLENNAKLTLKLNVIEIEFNKELDFCNVVNKKDYLYIQNNHLTLKKGAEENYPNLLEKLSKYKGSNKPFIIDVRNILGGNDAYVEDIMQSLGIKFNHYNLNEKALLAGALVRKPNFMQLFPEKYNVSVLNETPNFKNINATAIKPQYAHSPFIIMGSRLNGSACSCYYFNSVFYKNCIIMGDYTDGTIQFCPVRFFKLPYSGFSLNIGTSFNFHNKHFDIETIGYEPDLFILDMKNAEKIASKFINNYLL